MKLPFNVDLSSKVAVLTGAGGVIISEYAKALAASGAKVALLDINLPAAQKVADEIGENALAIETNALSKESLENAKKIVNEKFGKVNMLVNGAGGNNPKATTDNEYMTPDIAEGAKTFFDLDESGLKFVFDLNITSAFLTTQVFAPDMLENGGNIINLSSMNAFRPLTKIPAYSAAKAGISNFTQWLAVHFAPMGIRCNAIAPGFFASEVSPVGNEKFDNFLKSKCPMKRHGRPGELDSVIVFLAADESSYITGQIVGVDGGWTCI